MLTYHGIYNGQNIEILEPVLEKKKYKVLITFIEELPTQKQDNSRSFGNVSNGFDFWYDEKENIYQDYLNK